MSVPSVVPRPPAAPARRAAPHRLRRLAVASLAAIPLLVVAPPAEARTAETYMRCVNTVADWVDGCEAASGSWVGRTACNAAGVAGILVCAAAEAAEIAKGMI
jgi:hypothetical protein